MRVRIMLALALSCAVTFPASAAVNTNIGMQLGKDALATCEVTDEQIPSDMITAFACLSWVNGAVQGAMVLFRPIPVSQTIAHPKAEVLRNNTLTCFLSS